MLWRAVGVIRPAFSGRGDGEQMCMVKRRESLRHRLGGDQLGVQGLEDVQRGTQGLVGPRVGLLVLRVFGSCLGVRE